ncbi:hypothetical protein D9K80_14855 [Acinetobacter cumulans]|uniref:PD-(D/E)XK nuclease superfamily protein n=1 Tax=Acinetobacter cumulans TaxID=2136182 RepID=A0A498D139_9GAMM|nr:MULTISPECIES: PD-(D/E)XK nuclease family protein [Acinetobacter]RFS32249.1 hypothetical protein DYI81_06980 [Acinetobacter sp. SWAC5]RLL31629.1 hypothetical protein D9K80_14855 [Acinetobacter cumulans]
MDQPNIFKYATKELSQDAFIFWLLDHANPKYKNLDENLKKCALDLIAEFFRLENKVMPSNIEEFSLFKQYKNIDILLKINNYNIIIEDKTGTKSHGDQLIRYRNIIVSEVGEENVLAIFFKTHDQSSYKKELGEGFKVFSRENLISILNLYKDISSDIFNNFKDYILEIEEEVNAFIFKNEWNNKNWIGFFKYVQKELNRGNWGYVPNQNGGFMGYWWAFQKNEFCIQYLQIQQNELVLKINSNKAENDKKFRNICYQHFLEKAKHEGLSFSKPARFGKGETMTILKTDYLVRSESQLIDLVATMEKLRKYTSFIEKYALSADDFIH